MISSDASPRRSRSCASGSRRRAAIRARVRVVGVTKGQGLDAVRAAAAAGLVDLGESYAQELVAKAEAVDAAVRWHIIGRLQRNKVRHIAAFVHLWQSVDRLSLAGEIARHAPGASVLVQVNVSGAEQQGGCPPSAWPRWWRGAATSGSTCAASWPSARSGPTRRSRGGVPARSGELADGLDLRGALDGHERRPRGGGGGGQHDGAHRHAPCSVPGRGAPAVGK